MARSGRWYANAHNFTMSTDHVSAARMVPSSVGAGATITRIVGRVTIGVSAGSDEGVAYQVFAGVNYGGNELDPSFVGTSATPMGTSWPWWDTVNCLAVFAVDSGRHFGFGAVEVDVRGQRTFLSGDGAWLVMKPQGTVPASPGYLGVLTSWRVFVLDP